MSNNIKFDECLNSLLITLDISISRLSKVINVDSSLVNRWIHGKRIPPYNSNYIESISDYLSKNIFNKIQEQRLDEFFLKVCKELNLKEGYKEKIRTALLEAQGYSLECLRLERKNDKNGLNADAYKRDSSLTIDTIPLSADDKLVFGTENILAAGISLTEAAIKQGCQSNNIIYITYNNDLDITPCCDKLFYWRQLLLSALHSGWKVLFLFKLNNNINRTMSFINFILPLIKTGRFLLYYYKKYDTFTEGREVYIIPEVGALSCYSSNVYSEKTCAFYLQNKAAVEILNSHFNRLLTNYAQPIIKYYSQDISHEYCHAITENEENVGSRFVFNYGFGMLLLPESLYVKLLFRKNLSLIETHASMQLYRRQLSAIMSNVKHYAHKDLHLMDSITNLIRHHKFLLYTYSGIENVELETSEIHDLLQNVLHLLQTCDNYHLAFISRKSDSLMKIDDCFCVIRDRHTVFFEAFSSSKNIPDVRFSIDEPMTVKAVKEYFNEIWDGIAPVNKDKKEIIAWIQSQINLLGR